MTTVANLEVVVGSNVTGATSGFAKVNSGLTGIGTSATKSAGLLGKLGSMGPIMGTALIASVAAIGKGLLDMGNEAQAAQAQTEAAIKSTGGIANVTASDVDNLSQQILSYSGISDEAVASGQNMLLTFTNIRNEVGAGNDIFNQANVALADMATRMNNGVTPSAEQLSQQAIKLGKALNDPTAGITALSRVGVAFTDQQKAQITAMQASGDMMGAQKIILGELTTEFGGSAAAMGGTFAGQFNIMKETILNGVEAIVVALMQVAAPILSAIQPVVAAFAMVLGAVAKVAGAIIGFLAPAIGPLAIGLGILATVIGVVAAAIWVANGGLLALSVNPVTLAIIAIVAGILLLIRGIQLFVGWLKQGSAAAQVVGKVLAVIFAPVIIAVKIVGLLFKALGAIVSFVAKNWKAVLTALAIAFLPITIAIGLAIVVFNILKAVGIAVFNAIKSAVQAVAPVWNAVWQGAQAIFAAVWGAIQSVFETVVNGIITGINFVIGVINLLIAAYNKIPFHEDIPLIKELDHLGASAQQASTKLAGPLSSAITKAGSAAATAGTKAAGAAPKLSAMARAFGTGAAGAQRAATAIGRYSSITDASLSKILGKHKVTAQGIIQSLNKSIAAQKKAATDQAAVTKRLTDAGVKDAGKLVEAMRKQYGDQAPKLFSIMAKANDSNFSKIFNKWGTAQGETQPIISATDKIRSAVQGLNGLSANIKINLDVAGAAVGSVIANFARGGVASMGGLAMVGEHGPELVGLPTGARVLPAGDTARIVAAASQPAMPTGAGTVQQITGTLRLQGDTAYIEGVVIDTLEDGRIVDKAMTKAMGARRD